MNFFEELMKILDEDPLRGFGFGYGGSKITIFKNKTLGFPPRYEISIEKINFRKMLNEATGEMPVSMIMAERITEKEAVSALKEMNYRYKEKKDNK